MLTRGKHGVPAGVSLKASIVDAHTQGSGSPFGEGEGGCTQRSKHPRRL